ncbi:MAG: DUF421 domain-containing protein [Bacteroidota bacterium]|nr:DUF421 domain-containing protein [Bacteroidota bacterium]
MGKLFYDDYQNLLRIIISAPIIYILIIANIKLMGKRTTSQMNSFDWIVTVAMGSIVAGVVTERGVSILNGAVAVFTLMGLQYIITKLMLYSPFVKRLVRSTPKLLVFRGKFIEHNMKEERMLKSEVYSAIRESGLPGITEVYAVVLETDASLSVIGKSEKNTTLSLIDVGGLPQEVQHDVIEAKKANNL